MKVKSLFLAVSIFLPPLLNVGAFLPRSGFSIRQRLLAAGSRGASSSGDDNDSFDTDELREHIAHESRKPCSGAEFGPEGKGGSTFWDHNMPTRPDLVYIILFHGGEEQEGIHSIEYPKGSGSNMILAFESERACEKFADLLKLQDFFDPAVRGLVLVANAHQCCLLLSSYCCAASTFVACLAVRHRSPRKSS